MFVKSVRNMAPQSLQILYINNFTLLWRLVSRFWCKVSMECLMGGENSHQSVTQSLSDSTYSRGAGGGGCKFQARCLNVKSF